MSRSKNLLCHVYIHKKKILIYFNLITVVYTITHMARLPFIRTLPIVEDCLKIGFLCFLHDRCSNSSYLYPLLLSNDFKTDLIVN